MEIWAGAIRVTILSEDAMRDTAERVLLGDIGGTNARFALCQPGQLSAIESMPVADYGKIADALDAFLTSQGDRDAVSGAILAVAGPIEGERSKLTNASWVVDGGELRKKFGWRHAEIVNDFEAIAWALPKLAPGDLFGIGGGAPKLKAPSVAIGPGTGLGLACFLPRARDAIVMSTEGGHVTMPGTCQREDAILDYLRGCFGHVSAERVVSGGGLVNLYHAISAIDRRPMSERDAAQITAAALDGSCPICREALDTFCALLGTVAGNAALTFGARGGVYIAGGIAPRVVEYLAGSQFRSRFEEKGRYRSYLAATPVWVVTHPEPAFVGLQGLAARIFDWR